MLWWWCKTKLHLKEFYFLLLHYENFLSYFNVSWSSSVDSIWLAGFSQHHHTVTRWQGLQQRPNRKSNSGSSWKLQVRQHLFTCRKVTWLFRCDMNTRHYCLFILLPLFVSRGGVLNSAVCLNAGARYFVDVIFNKQPGSDGSHILIDSVRNVQIKLILTLH